MLLPGPLKGLFRGSRGGQPGNGLPSPGNGGRSLFTARSPDEDPDPYTRTSRGLEEFFTYIRDQSGLTILDLGGATQKNVSFITDLGHRLYSEDFLQILKDTFGVADTVDQFLEAVSRALAAGKHIEIRGFGTFKVKDRKSRLARNPRTGESVPVPPRRVPVFKVSKELKDIVAQV